MSYFYQLDLKEKIQSIRDQKEMDSLISINIKNIFIIFNTFINKLRNGFHISKNDISSCIDALIFVDHFNLFMDDSKVLSLLKCIDDINSYIGSKNYMDFDSRNSIIEQIKYTKMTIINHNKKYFRELYFKNPGQLPEIINSELDQVNKNNKFNGKLFKQLQNIFWVVKNVISDSEKKTNLENKLDEMKKLKPKYKKNIYENSYEDDSKYYYHGNNRSGYNKKNIYKNYNLNNKNLSEKNTYYSGRYKKKDKEIEIQSEVTLEDSHNLNEINENDNNEINENNNNNEFENDNNNNENEKIINEDSNINSNLNLNENNNINTNLLVQFNDNENQINNNNNVENNNNENNNNQIIDDIEILEGSNNNINNRKTKKNYRDYRKIAVEVPNANNKDQNNYENKKTFNRNGYHQNQYNKGGYYQNNNRKYWNSPNNQRGEFVEIDTNLKYNEKETSQNIVNKSPEIQPTSNNINIIENNNEENNENKNEENNENKNENKNEKNNDENNENKIDKNNEENIKNKIENNNEENKEDNKDEKKEENQTSKSPTNNIPSENQISTDKIQITSNNNNFIISNDNNNINNNPIIEQQINENQNIDKNQNDFNDNNISNEEESEEIDDAEIKGQFHAFMIEATGRELKGDYDYKKNDFVENYENENEFNENDLNELMEENIENDIVDFEKMTEEEKEVELKCRELLKELNIPHLIDEALNELEDEELKKINENKKNENENNYKENINDIPKRNKYSDTLKTIDPKLLGKIRGKIQDDYKIQEILTPKFSFIENIKDNPYIFSLAFDNVIKSYKEENISGKMPLLYYIFYKYNCFNTNNKDSENFKNYLKLKYLEHENPELIWENIQNFEKKILIPLYQKIIYNSRKKSKILLNIFERYSKIIKKVCAGKNILEKVLKYGSSQNTFLDEEGDVDICIIPKCSLDDFQTYLEEIQKEIYESKIGETRFKYNSGSYILLTIYDNQSESNVDITVHNLLPICNSDLIKLYSLFDQRFHILGLYLKHWSKLNKVHGASNGYLSSYALLIMMIYFLQKIVEPKILPNLQKIPYNNDYENPVYLTEPYDYIANGNHFSTNVYFEKDFQKMNDYMTKINNGKVNKESVGNLLVNFFEYFAYYFDQRQKISIHKELKETIKMHNEDNYAFSIDDPFEISNNPGKTMIYNEPTFIKFSNAMQKEVNLILSGEYVRRLNLFIGGGNVGKNK